MNLQQICRSVLHGSAGAVDETRGKTAAFAWERKHGSQNANAAMASLHCPSGIGFVGHKAGKAIFRCARHLGQGMQ